MLRELISSESRLVLRCRIQDLFDRDMDVGKGDLVRWRVFFAGCCAEDGWMDGVEIEVRGGYVKVGWLVEGMRMWIGGCRVHWKWCYKLEGWMCNLHKPRIVFSALGEMKSRYIIKPCYA